MEYTNESLYYLGFSDSNNLKGQPEDYTMQNGYRDNNIMTDDGIYSMGTMAGGPMHLAAPSPNMGYQELSPMGYGTAPAANTDMAYSSSTSNFQYPDELNVIVNNIIKDQDDFPILGDEFSQLNLDLNINATMGMEGCELDDALDLFGNNVPLELAPPSYETSMTYNGSAAPEETTQRHRKVRKSKTAANASFLEAETASPSLLSYDMYPNPADLGVPSPASSSSSYSDVCSLNGDATTTTTKQRQRRPRVSYSTLSEEEKYKRIRDLNNEASRHYRERQKGQLSTLEDQLPELLEKNTTLKDKAAALEKLRDQMQHYSNAFLKQHMANTNNGGFQ